MFAVSPNNPWSLCGHKSYQFTAGLEYVLQRPSYTHRFSFFFSFVFCSKTTETDESVDTTEKKEETETAGTNTGDVSR